MRKTIQEDITATEKTIDLVEYKFGQTKETEVMRWYLDSLAIMQPERLADSILAGINKRCTEIMLEVTEIYFDDTDPGETYL